LNYRSILIKDFAVDFPDKREIDCKFTKINEDHRIQREENASTE
jgi:hypothetical protein